MAKDSTTMTKVHLTKTEIRRDLHGRYLEIADRPDTEPEKRTETSDRLQRRELYVSSSGGNVHKKQA